jgi:hypothetical protein
VMQEILLFTGHRLSDHTVVQASHVKTFLLPLLAAPNLDHAGSRADADQTCRREGFALSIELLVGKGNLHENQLRQSGIRTLID